MPSRVSAARSASARRRPRGVEEPSAWNPPLGRLERDDAASGSGRTRHARPPASVALTDRWFVSRALAAVARATVRIERRRGRLGEAIEGRGEPGAGVRGGASRSATRARGRAPRRARRDASRPPARFTEDKEIPTVVVVDAPQAGGVAPSVRRGSEAPGLRGTGSERGSFFACADVARNVRSKRNRADDGARRVVLAAQRAGVRGSRCAPPRARPRGLGRARRGAARLARALALGAARPPPRRRDRPGGLRRTRRGRTTRRPERRAGRRGIMKQHRVESKTRLAPWSRPLTALGGRRTRGRRRS